RSSAKSTTSPAAVRCPTSCRCSTSRPSCACSRAEEGVAMTHTHSHDHYPHRTATRMPGVARIGIGGPVGSGKTALIEALVPWLIEAGHSPLVVTNDIFTQEDAHHVRAALAGLLAPERVVGVETGSCPHTAVRDDPSMNLDAIARLERLFLDGDVV